ncbi:hypothetical protein HYDPIDRAFT_27120 [Hydnomerulius pinastri MD-312]|nr:hypothetical protein HYDPIDRAFT_27120 [Hydnomerulius pinastri MD-312]
MLNPALDCLYLLRHFHGLFSTFFASGALNSVHMVTEDSGGAFWRFWRLVHKKSNKKSENSEDGVLIVRDSEHEGFSTLQHDDDAVRYFLFGILLRAHSK